ncbi:MAG: DNA methyltransferase [Candidatus Woesearchaeota archaeon]
MYFVVVSKDHPDIAVAELNSMSCNVSKVCGNLVFCRTITKFCQRLAYSNFCYKYLFCCNLSILPRRMKEFSWQSVCSKDFCVRLHGSKEYSEKELASYVWKGLKNPKVNLDNPKTMIGIFVMGDTACAGILVMSNTNDFGVRKAHLRPALHPSSLHPKLARAMVNMTGIKSGVLLDPFCGTGGILIEAALIGLSPLGCDISQKMVDAAKKNLEHFGLQARVKSMDALMLRRKVRFVATDLPYGRNTRADSRLYKDFFRVLDKILVRKAVVGLPSTVRLPDLLSGTRLKCAAAFDYYLHKSLSKKLVILQKAF